MGRMRINNFNELIDFIKNEDVSINDINKLTQVTIGGILVTSRTRVEAIANILNYWKKYSDTKEKPIFIDLDDPLEQKEYINDVIDKL